MLHLLPHIRIAGQVPPPRPFPDNLKGWSALGGGLRKRPFSHFHLLKRPRLSGPT